MNLIIANKDGSDERKLISRRMPDPDSWIEGNPAWPSDGNVTSVGII